jgi:hypothetical protein
LIDFRFCQNFSLFEFFRFFQGVRISAQLKTQEKAVEAPSGAQDDGLDDQTALMILQELSEF